MSPCLAVRIQLNKPFVGLHFVIVKQTLPHEKLPKVALGIELEAQTRFKNK